MSRSKLMTVRGLFQQAAPLDLAELPPAPMPEDFFYGEEYLLWVVGTGISGFGIRVGDLLTIELRPDGSAAPGELVLARDGDSAYLGHWWNKGGRRAVLDANTDPVVEGEHLQVFGAVTFVSRLVGGRRP